MTVNNVKILWNLAPFDFGWLRLQIGLGHGQGTLVIACPEAETRHNGMGKGGKGR